MQSTEAKVLPSSDYYVYAPSALAKKLYLYPLSTGYFMYEPDYYISRNHFDSFLIMYISAGSCNVSIEGLDFCANTGQFILLDCYVPHSYGSPHAWEASWLHFDGKLAREYFEEIISHHGHVLNPQNSSTLIHSLDTICGYFRTASPIVEADISSHITNILNSFLAISAEHQKKHGYTLSVADSIAYINEHFRDDLSLEVLAEKANISLYHFSRIFTRETGFTPHQYLINTRISAAKFLLKSSEASIKDIAFSTGFNSESSFCSTFKKWEHITPSQYRSNILGI